MTRRGGAFRRVTARFQVPLAATGSRALVLVCCTWARLGGAEFVERAGHIDAVDVFVRAVGLALRPVPVAARVKTAEFVGAQVVALSVAQPAWVAL